MRCDAMLCDAAPAGGSSTDDEEDVELTIASSVAAAAGHSLDDEMFSTYIVSLLSYQLHSSASIGAILRGTNIGARFVCCFTWRLGNRV